MSTNDVARAITELPVPTTGMVRISVGHNVTGIIRANDSLMTAHPVGILASGPWNMQRTMRFQALGGAVALTDAGQDYMAKQFGARHFYRDAIEGVTDARCEMAVEYVKSALLWLANAGNAPEFFEASPYREVIDELSTAELANFSPVCRREDLQDMRLFYRGVAVQPPPDDGTGTSINAGKTPTRRLFHCWELALPVVAFDAVMEAEQMHRFTPTELASTNGGRQQGELDDGTAKIADNIGLEVIPT